LFVFDLQGHERLLFVEQYLAELRLRLLSPSFDTTTRYKNKHMVVSIHVYKEIKMVYSYDPTTGKRLMRSGIPVNPIQPMTQKEVDEQHDLVNAYLEQERYGPFTELDEQEMHPKPTTMKLKTRFLICAITKNPKGNPCYEGCYQELDALTFPVTEIEKAKARLSVLRSQGKNARIFMMGEPE
jgi:hypothetical protein